VSDVPASDDEVPEAAALGGDARHRDVLVGPVGDAEADDVSVGDLVAAAVRRVAVGVRLDPDEPVQVGRCRRGRAEVVAAQVDVGPHGAHAARDRVDPVAG
jgi:hypothetical protein